MEILVWPATVLLFSLIVFFVLRRTIVRFLDRAEKLGITRDGIEAGMSHKNDETRTHNVNSNRPPVSPPEDILRLLVRTLFEEQSKALRTRSFESIYLLIRTEQLRILRHIGDTGGQISVHELQQWYERITTEAAIGDVDNMIPFLRDTRLVMENQGILRVTYEGYEYLNFLRDRGYAP